jgi:hypothetical protein
MPPLPTISDERYSAPDIVNGYRRRAALRHSSAFADGDLDKKYQQSTFGAHFVEVGVDAATGEIRVRRMLAVCASGRILNPKTARSQVIGAMTMGVGAALMEELAVDKRAGYFVNHDLAGYEVPVHTDLGGSATGADPDTFALILRNLLGAKVKLATGYPGGNDINLAMERGEVEGRCGWSWTSIKSQKTDWLRDRKISLLAQFGMEKNADLPDVPLVLERATNDEQRQVLRLLIAGQFVGRPFFAPPELPDDRKGALRQAFDATMKDPQFLAEAGRLDMEISPIAAAVAASAISK